MPSESDVFFEKFVSNTISVGRRLRILKYLKISLAVLCWVALLAGVSIKIMGGQSKVIIFLGLIGGALGLASMLSARIEKTVYLKSEHLRAIHQHLIYRLSKKNLTAVHAKIPLTIGFANLSGADLSAILSEDATALSPLFFKSVTVPDHQIPSAEILFVYAHLNEDGTIKGVASSGVRQIVQLTNAAIVVLASPNDAASIQNAAILPGPKTANIVFTFDRNGSGFSEFFCELFGKMQGGKDMLSAWVEISPQNHHISHYYAPQTILLAEAGKIAFP
ncbi:hypothetical protein [Pseudomonas sp. GD03944]|uniref:hypothetical protein n=1 Tax=Pseudomonas sp. GD03944 TaxID=2975409 RepID=UPI0024483B1C|nr:hypothetical protein [Pseudomonas sp. GD03944]MDH1261967.1 hypothetical protein [Pseudomonas sp. GD03944]